MSSSSLGLPPRSKSSSVAQSKLKEEELRKRMRTAWREKALKAMLHTYDLRGVNPEEAMKVAHQAVQSLGGAGYLSDNPVGRIFRDAKLMEIGAGTSEIRRMLIGRELVSLMR